MMENFVKALFPAPAGMNRSPRPNLWTRLSVPRARGDEPRLLVNFGMGIFCSPRLRR